MSFYLILLFSIFFFALAKVKLDWAVMLILAALPTYLIRFSVVGVPMTLLELMILIAFGVWFVWQTNFLQFVKGKYGWKDLKINKEKRQAYPFGLELSLLLLISFVAVGVSGFSNNALGIWKAYFFEPALLYILVLNVFKNKDFKFFVWPFVVSVLGVSLLAVYQKITGNLIFNPLWAAADTRRVVSFFGYPNAVGLYLAPLSVIVFGWFLDEIKKIKFWQSAVAIGALCLSLASIYFARSEGALIGLAAGSFVFCLMAGKKIRWTAIVLFLIMSAGVFFYQPAKNKIEEKILLKDLSGEIRKQQWRETWQMLENGKMITGAGLSSYQTAIKPYHQEGIFFNFDNNPNFRNLIVWGGDEYKKKYWQPVEIYMYPHNIILNFWTELGFFGMLLFVWIIGKFFVVAIKNHPSWAEKKIGVEKDFQNYFLNIGLLCALIVIVVHGLVDVPYFKNDLAAMFWIFTAMLSLIKLRKIKSTL